MFSTNISFEAVVLLTIIPVQLLAVILQIVGLVECKQCLLFAKIYEIERILEGGFVGWCYMIIVHGFILMMTCIVMLWRRPILGIRLKRLFVNKHVEVPPILLGLRADSKLRAGISDLTVYQALLT